MWKEIIVPACLFGFTSFVGWFIRIKAKADKAETINLIESESKGKMKAIKERLSSVEDSIRTIENSHDRRFDKMDSKFDLMMSEMKNQGDSMKRQADHIVKVFQEIKDISVTLANKQDRE